MAIHITRDAASTEFYDGTAEEMLLLRRCRTCGRISAPMVTQCPTCESTDLDWSPAAGSATLVSWAVRHPADGGDPVVAGLVELTEGPWLRARIADCPSDLLTAGLALTVQFEHPAPDQLHETAGETVPVFTPADK
ncbi:putative nucleic-acid-binding protein containing a Zn-ribbon [Nocardia nova SH22a]|uniref:Putative nucleic-acid-binding protein containing a Zn-ribbon n=1 Tax=Nocardia nova SH22a TaxID=1415166 RepID=W5TL49_9NOCA|nr:OB-fold domain-containing protein [Nocardia nova]AHH19992.1 putative nucleic-acid-binding protein containing a Zn-ribbon [Nocardia nova SH22a]